MILDFLRKIFKQRENSNPLRIGVFGIMNNPEYRQEPWKESIQNRLEIFDSVCIVCGNEADIEMLQKQFPHEWSNGKLKAIYKFWPFPEWSYEELAKHLNSALSLVKKQECDWAIKLDIDTVFHEKDKKNLIKSISLADKKDKWLVSFGKLQFFLPTFYWKKGNLPIAINLKKPIAYGFDENKYTDLCQPIEWDGYTLTSFKGEKYEIPVGEVVDDKRVLRIDDVKLYNYDFTFRTYERSIELLYQIEMAHARFWGKSYSGIPIESISRETSICDFLKLSKDRFKNMSKKMEISGHPRHFQIVLQNLNKDQWGFGLWDKILI